MLIPHLSTAESTPPLANIQTQIEQMSLDQKVGQLFILGFPQAKMTTELAHFIEKQKPGAFVLFKRNISSLADVAELNTHLYDLSLRSTSHAPLIAVDQEGGQVVRIATTPPMPSALALGQTKSPQLAEESGAESAKVLSSLGFNLNLAPVLDVVDPTQFSFIGLRSFGADPQTVAQMGYHYSKGLILNGVVPTGKHFPGTGSLTTDPHHGSVINKSSLEDLEKTSLPPFQEFAKLGFYSALMLSHSAYQSLDESGTSAIFSKKIITDLLRQKLQFRGLVITDDLQMAASRSLLKPEEAALKALQAGSDLVMLTWSFSEQAKAIQRVKEAITSGELSTTDLNEKLSRILKVKAFLNKSFTLRLPASLAKNSISSEKLEALDDAILEKNLGQSSADKPGATLCVFSASLAFLQSFRETYSASLATKTLTAQMTAPDVEKVFREKNCGSLLFSISGKQTSRLLNNLSAQVKRKTLVINLNLPGLIAKTSDYQKVINVYFPHVHAGKKMAQLLNESSAKN